MKPSRAFTVYCAVSFVIGLSLAVPLAFWVRSRDLGVRGAALVTLCWNVLCVMVLPLVLDWSEQKYFKTRFLKLEEVASSNPELASALEEQCQKLSLPGLKLAVIDSPSSEMFVYGLGGNNPRLVLPNAMLKSLSKAEIIPSIEAELIRFRHQRHTFVFLFFAAVQIITQQVLLALID